MPRGRMRPGGQPPARAPAREGWPQSANRPLHPRAPRRCCTPAQQAKSRVRSPLPQCRAHHAGEGQRPQQAEHHFGQPVDRVKRPTVCLCAHPRVPAWPGPVQPNAPPRQASATADAHRSVAVGRMSPTPPCHPPHRPLNSPPTERWPSGRRRTPGKCVGGEPSRGFESLSVRHLSIKISVLRFLIGLSP